jgi:hypothetical protein
MNYIENLKQAIATVEAQPEDQLDLTTYHCGSAFCAAGLLAVTPYFTNLGMFPAEITGAPNCFLPYGKRLGHWGTFSHLFGPWFDDCAPFDVLFNTYRFGAWDGQLINEYHKQHGDVPSHKQLALLRLRKALAIREAEAANATA